LVNSELRLLSNSAPLVYLTDPILSSIIFRIFIFLFGDTVSEVKSLKIARNMVFFLVGGSAYVGLELLWRRRSHISMFCAGGICFLSLGKIRRLQIPYPLRVLAGSMLITAVELTVGLLVNRDHHVWDYRKVPGNYRGQICLPFSLLWIPVSALGMGLYGLAEKAGEGL
jgi:hypothetical protein